MSKRKKTSGGQAIVMVTLALVSMAGMMGLAVDLGWSYFTQKTAQASADGAALAAVHEAWARKSGLSVNWSCGTGNSASYCQTGDPVNCSTIQSDTSSNLYHGCLYAINNGFNYTSASARQNVTMQANVGPSFGGAAPPTVTGILPANIVYWVTVRTVQTVPQLFSAVLGNTQGTVAATATAAAVNTILPGSFYGLNREGDCLTDGAGGTKYGCGVDISVKSAGHTNCLDAAGNNTGITGKVCAAGGIFLSSVCNGTNIAGCQDPGSASSNFAGDAENNAIVWGGSTTAVRTAGNNVGSVSSDGKVAGDQNWIPAHTNSTQDSLFQDPTHKLPQPPLMTNGALGTCGIQGGVLHAGTFGPYQYYSYTNKDSSGVPIPDGKTITVGSNDTVNFASNGNCPGYSTSGAAPGSFPDYIFYGGLVMNPSNGGNNTTVNFGSGQYVMAGTLNNTATSGCDGPCVFAANNNGYLNGDANGTMFIFTDTKYAGLSTQVQAIPNYSHPQSQIPNLVQGDIEMKNVTATLTAPKPDPGTTLAPYSNFLFWQDRRNSTDTLNLNDGSVVTQGTPCSTCDVTNTSPRFLMGPGGGAMNLTGVLYQPRGAWFEMTSGGSSTAGNLRLQLVTGAITCGSGGCGAATVTLLSPTAPIIEFVTALIQ